jgi:hypothetical protein
MILLQKRKAAIHAANLIKILAKLLVPISSRDVIGQLKFNNKVHYLKLEHGRPFNRM